MATSCVWALANRRNKTIRIIEDEWHSFSELSSYEALQPRVIDGIKIELSRESCCGMEEETVLMKEVFLSSVLSQARSLHLVMIPLTKRHANSRMISWRLLVWLTLLHSRIRQGRSDAVLHQIEIYFVLIFSHNSQMYLLQFDFSTLSPTADCGSSVWCERNWMSLLLSMVFTWYMMTNVIMSVSDKREEKDA